jgi:hypothetical protein
MTALSARGPRAHDGQGPCLSLRSPLRGEGGGLVPCHLPLATCQGTPKAQVSCSSRLSIGVRLGLSRFSISTACLGQQRVYGAPWVDGALAAHTLGGSGSASIAYDPLAYIHNIDHIYVSTVSAPRRPARDGHRPCYHFTSPLRGRGWVTIGRHLSLATS